MCSKILVETTSGTVRGKEGFAFLGIPYGTARRFQPAEQARWSGVKDCTEYGPRAPQPNFLGKKKEGVTFSCLGDEDCLNLNIWTQALGPEVRQPVVVYVHGGGYQVGRNSDPMRAGDRFAGGDSMVFVSVNYRLGVLGGLYLGELLGEEYRHSGSNAELDLLLAIRWVKENIAAFGGDPENITLFGVSAGAKNISSLMTLPQVNGLFQKVLLESGATQSLRSTRVAGQIARHYLDLFEGKSAEYLLTCPVEELIQKQAQLCDRNGSTALFGPVLEGELFSDIWRERWDRGEGWKGAAVIGCAKSEMYNEVHAPGFLERAQQTMETAFGENAPKVMESVRALTDAGQEELEAWTRVYSDYMYCAHADRFAQRLIAQGNPVWQYRFSFWPAAHGMGFAYTMRQETSPMSIVPQEKMAQASALAEKMNRFARHFILTGRPDCPDLSNWQPSTGDSVYRLIFDGEITVEQGPQVLLQVPDYMYD